MSMFPTRPVNSEHKDLIHDVAFDYHGRRMATCSSDQTVKVWDLGDDSQWHCTASWKTHSGSVWRVTWANPEFGQVLATCSFDRTAGVWEEMVGLPAKEGGQSHSSHWLRKTNLVDSRTSVTDVKFAPKHLGLQLATCSADGIVRIYEAVDVMTLSNWPLQHEINCRLSCSCLSWNSSRLHPPMLAVGSDDSSSPSTPKVQVYEYNEGQRKWLKVENLSLATEPVHDVAFAPNLGRSHHLLAIASRDLKIVSLKPLSGTPAPSGQAGLSKFEIRQVAEFNDHDSQVWRVSWNVTGTVLASSGDDGMVRLWKANYLGSWRCAGVLQGGGNQPPEAVTLQPLQNASSQQQQQGGPLATPTAPSGVRYIKTPSVASASHVPWH